MNIELEPLALRHLSQYITLLNDPEVRKTTQPYEAFAPIPEETLRQWLEKISKPSDRRDFAIINAETKDLIGEIVLNEVQGKKANLRLAIASAYWGQGIGSRAMHLALEHAFIHMGLEEISLSVFDINERGLRLYKKMGFEIVSQDIYEGFPETLMSITFEKFKNKLSNN